MDSDLKSYTIQVKSAKGLSMVRSRIPFRKDRPPKAYIQLTTNGLSARTNTARRGQQARWNESFPIFLAGAESLKVEAFHDSRHGNRIIGKTTLTQLAVKIDDQDIVLQADDGVPAGWLTIVITQDSVTAKAAIHTQVKKAATEARDISGSDLPSIRIPDPAIDLGKSFGNLLKNIDGVMALMDQLATINPIAKAAWTIVSTVYELVKNQVDRDQKISDLLQAVNEAYSYITSLEEIRKRRDLDRVVTELLNLTICCVYFIQEYARKKSFAGRMLTTLFTDCDAKLEQYQRLFADIRTQLGTHVAIDSALTIARVATNLNNLEISHNLQQLDPLKMDTSARPRCLPDTRVDHVQFISEWITSLSEDNILWISGVAGAGKSTLVNSIADIYGDVRRLGAFIYFTRDEAAHSSPGPVVKTIAFQLAKFDQRLGRAISTTIQADNQALNRTLSAQFDAFIGKPIRSVASLADEGPIVIVIDALDECGSAMARKELVRILSEKLTKLPPSFRVIVTSRPEPDLETTFRTARHIRKHELDISSEQSKADVGVYIRSRLSDFSKRGGRDWPEEDRAMRLIDRAGGFFIWASTACDLIEAYPTDNRLNNVLSLSAPTPLEGLHQLYGAALVAAGDWKDDFASDCRSILGLVIAVRVPLSCSAIDTLLRPAQPSAMITEQLKSLLQWSETGPIRPLHASFADYLTDSESCHSKPWFIDLASEHETLVNLCLDLLGRELKENMLGLMLAPEWIDSCKGVQRSLSEATAYACTSWIKHVCAVVSDSAKQALSEKVLVFFRAHLLHWIEAMSSLRQSRSCAVLLGELTSWIPAAHQDLLLLINDAVRFCRLFANEVEQHPLLVYHSAIPFAPPESIIRHSFPSRYLRVAGVENRWSPLLQTFSYPPDSLYAGSYIGSIVGIVALSPDGRSVAAAGLSGIRVWDIISGTELLHIPSKAKSLAFITNGTRFVTGECDGTLQFWDANDGNHLCSMNSHTSQVQQIVACPSVEMDLIASVEESGHIRFCHSDGSRAPELPVMQRQDVIHCAFSSDGYQLATLHRDLKIRLWQLPDGREDGALDRPVNRPVGRYVGRSDRLTRGAVVCFVDLDKSILTHAAGDICLWDTRTRTCLRSCSLQGYALAISPRTGHLFYRGTFGLSWRDFDYDGDRPLHDVDHSLQAFEMDAGRIASLDVSPDGRTLASGSEDGTVRLWTMADVVVQTQSLHAYSLRAGIVNIAISPDERFIVTLAEYGLGYAIRFWDVDTACVSAAYPVVHTLYGFHSPNLPLSEVIRQAYPSSFESDPELDFRFSADGRRVALRKGVQAKVWDVQTGKKLPPDEPLNDFDWEFHHHWNLDDDTCWVRRDGTCVTKLPSKGMLVGGGSTAVFKENGTDRIYILRLPVPHSTADGRIEERA